MSNAELRRKVGYKPRRKSGARRSTHHGPERSYQAFLALPEGERARAGEMDTVCGRPTDSQCLLTLLSRACKVQLPLLMAERTKAATVEALDEVERAVGLDAFRRLLDPILTDNGGEFEDAEGIERSCTRWGERRCRVYYCDPMQSQQKGACERVCTMAHTLSYVLSAVMCRDRRRRCPWRGPRHITHRPSERVQEVQDALRRLVTRVSGIAPFDSDLLEGLLLCLHVRHHVLVRGVDVLVAEPDGNGGDIDPGI